jgi:tRNA-binding EMAP/Myf-like protein
MEENSKSTNKVEVVPVEMTEHPNADSLSIVMVDGYTTVVKTEEWIGINQGAFIPPENIYQNERVKARKFRGIWSQGLLVSAPKGSSIGDDVTSALGVTHYIPEEEREENKARYHNRGDQGKAPKAIAPEYDVDSGLKYSRQFEGEEIVACEKIEGQNFRCVAVDGEFFVGSHYTWKKEDPTNVFWQTAIQNPWIKEWCFQNPEYVVYGESYGNLKAFPYDKKPGEIGLKVFDIMKDGKFLNYDVAKEMGKSLQWVREVYRGIFQLEEMKTLSDNLMAFSENHIAEGIVFRTVTEKWNAKMGRMMGKIKSSKYLEKKK